MDKHNLELVTKLRRKLHSEPELSGSETETKNCLIEFLKKHTSLKIVDKGKWFYALYWAAKGRPNLAFRADMDAVAVNESPGLEYSSGNPGVAHKCGHDGHSAILAALAMEVDKHGAEKNIFFLFQHAEENAEGAKECTALIDECDINEIYGLHNAPGLPKGYVALRDETIMCASVGITVSLTGVSTHASTPEKGINPAAALAEIILELPKISDSSLYGGMVMITVIHCETGTKGAFGVSASLGSLSVTCRSEHDEDMNKLKTLFHDKAREAAKRHKLDCEFSCHDSFPATINHKACADKVREAAGKLGQVVVELEEPIRSSEDFGYYLQSIPGAFFFIGAGDCPDLHSWDYDFPDDIIENAVKLFKALVH